MTLDLFSFFADQRRQWYDRTGQYPAEYVTGGWTALLQAEVVFKRGPLYNAHLETQQARRALEDASYQLLLARKRIQLLEEQHAAATVALKEVKKESNRRSENHKRRAARTRRALQRVQDVAGLDEFEPEVRLRYIQELLGQHLALEQDENRAEQVPPAA
jgi:hypothetical protein